jgi:hypothetical protein
MYELVRSDDVLLFELNCADEVVIGLICLWVASVILHDRRALFLSPTVGQFLISLEKKSSH